MKIYIKQFCWLIVGVLIPTISIAQNIITLSAPESFNKTHEACKEVNLLPGYSFTAFGGAGMHSYINQYKVCNVDYITGFSNGTAPAALNTSYEVGTTAGSFEVSSFGGASYTIPLIVPPGTAGMAPNLSLKYNSFGNDGILGIGWDLAGLSSITRTSQTFYHDTKVNPVSLTNTDRFALDGARLIVTNGGAYGANATTYGKENESFELITSLGIAGTGPERFTVETKNGTILEYGGTVDSRIEADGSTTILTWLLNKVTDNHGNYLTIVYSENSFTGEHRPDHIDYTGTINFTPYNQIKFVYGNRSDKQIGYVAGHKTLQSVLLVGIEMYAQGNKVHEYNFNYSYDMGSHLSELIEKGADNKRYNSTKFSWDNNYNIKPNENPISYFDDKQGDYLSADVNGDGFSDVIRLNLNNWYLYKNDFLTTGNVSFSQPPANSSGILDPNISYINQPFGKLLRHSGGGYDLNGDGLDDMLVFLPETGQEINEYVLTHSGDPVNCEFKYFLSNGSGLVAGASTLLPQNTVNSDGNKFSNTAYTLGDFDGDGTIDLFVYYSSDAKWYIYSFKTGTPILIASGQKLNFSGLNSGIWEESQWIYSLGVIDASVPFSAYPQLCNFYAFDMNGDGKDEIIVVGDGKYRDGSGISSGKETFYVNELTTTGLSEILSDYYPSQSYGNLEVHGNENTIRIADFNGDNKTDMLVYKTGTGWRISYSTGNSFITSSSTLPLSNYIPFNLDEYSISGTENKHEYITADFNNDGKADIVEKLTDGVNGTDIHTMYGVGNDLFIEDNTHFTNTYSKTDYLFSAVHCVGDFNGDTKLDFILRDGDPSRPSGHFSLLPNENIHKIHQITNGFNMVTRIEYNSLQQLAQQNKYLKGNSAIFPVVDFQKHLMVASKSWYSNGLLNDINEINYFYQGAKRHQQGKGFLGFTLMGFRDIEREILQENTYNEPTLSNFFQHLLQESKTSVYTGSFASEVRTKVHQYQINPLGSLRHHTYVNQVTDNDVLHGNSTVYTFHSDAYGNIDHTTTNNSAISSVTTNAFEQKGAYIPSRLTSTSTSTIHMTSPVYTRSSNYTNDIFGQPITIIADGGNTTSSISYDNFGNALSSNVIGSDIITRTLSNAYDNKGRFVIQQTNVLGHSNQMTYDEAYGNILTIQDPNLLFLQYFYDGFGRLVQTITPTGEVIKTSQSWNNSVALALYEIKTTESGMQTYSEYIDPLGRTLQTKVTGFDGSDINSITEYNNIGQVVKTTAPFYSGNIPAESTISYDFFLRPSTINNASGSTVNYSYSGNTTTTTTITGSGTQTVSKTIDASGLVTSVTDNGGTLNYLYHSCGKPLTISIPGTAQTVMMTYDFLGRQTILSDPDAGTYNYSYDALGELKSMQDPNGNIHTYNYDALGRIITNTGSSSEGTITYIYDNRPHGLGQLGTINTTGSFIGNQELSYDNYSRLQSIKEINIDGDNYTTSFQYDNLNRIIKETYPGSGFSVKREYNNNGYLEKIRKASDNSLIWQCNSMTERGQVLSATTGNGSVTNKAYSNLGFPENTEVINSSNMPIWKQGYEFDPSNGNLISRSDNLLNPDFHKEEFFYDDLDRLVQVKLDGTVSLNTSYSVSGNINSKSDVGNYDYTAPQPHAVTGISSPVSAFPYLQQNVTYNEFKRAKVITQDVNEAELFYGADYMRKKMVMKNSGMITVTKYYFGNYEKTVDPSNNIREVNYIGGTDGLCAIFEKNITGGVATETMYYINTDHLGSIALVSDMTGNVLQEVSYDPWGKRRSASTWTNSSTTINYLFDRGFTGHEHLEQLNLINMNARLYDPIVGRMLNADDYVQSPGSTQSYNRYSYVINNPLKYTDPSGNSISWELTLEADPLPEFLEKILEAMGFTVGHYTGKVSLDLPAAEPETPEQMQERVESMEAGEIVNNLTSDPDYEMQGNKGNELINMQLPGYQEYDPATRTFTNDRGDGAPINSSDNMDKAFGTGPTMIIPTDLKKRNEILIDITNNPGNYRPNTAVLNLTNGWFTSNSTLINGMWEASAKAVYITAGKVSEKDFLEMQGLGTLNTTRYTYFTYQLGDGTHYGRYEVHR